MKLIQNLKLALGGLLVAGLAACGGAGGGGAESGTLRLAMTDAPSCGYDAVNVTVQKVRVHQSSSASDSDGGWSEIVLNPAKRIDLLNLHNGVLAELGQTPLPVGKYTQLRMILVDNKDVPFANAVTLTTLPASTQQFELTTPSGQQSGIKANIDITIAPNKLADFVIDFDACKSVVSAGGSGKYLLKPVVTVIPRYISGVAGFVDTSIANGSTTVSAQQNGVIIKSTIPTSSGTFLLQPVAPGNYTLVVTAPGRTTAIVTSVPVVTDTVTSINSSTMALTPTFSATGTLSGTSTTGTFMLAQQVLTSSPSFAEVAGRYVDGSTGSYAFVLPVKEPMIAPYVASPGALAFATPNSSLAGKYQLTASLPGYPSKLLTPAQLTTGATIMTYFTFP